MWQFFTKKIPDEFDRNSRPALILLGMVASSDPRWGSDVCSTTLYLKNR
jgi:hypothetical protein